MPKRNMTMKLINDRIQELNLRRAKIGLKPVKRCWTGLAHWLKEPTGEDSHSYRMGRTYFDDKAFLGFLDGLLYEQSQGDALNRRIAILNALRSLRAEGGQLPDGFCDEVRNLLANRWKLDQPSPA